MLERELDAGDAAFLDEAAEQAAAGGCDYFPVESPGKMVERILAGVHRLRVWGGCRSPMTWALADRSGIGRRSLVEFETRRTPSSVAADRRLADALGLTLGDIVPADANGRTETDRAVDWWFRRGRRFAQAFSLDFPVA